MTWDGQGVREYVTPTMGHHAKWILDSSNAARSADLMFVFVCAEASTMSTREGVTPTGAGWHQGCRGLHARVPLTKPLPTVLSMLTYNGATRQAKYLAEPGRKLRHGSQAHSVLRRVPLLPSTSPSPCA
jgi:hypothetical protein